MDFNKKLQELRKQKGITQEELAKALYVSRAAISKWESGRGYPNIDSIQALAKYFSISIDELLSTDEALKLAKEENIEKEKSFRDLIFGLLDVSFALFFFLPFFGQEIDGVIYEVSLWGLNAVQSYIRVAFMAAVTVMILYGILTLSMQSCKLEFWVRSKHFVSLVIGAFAVLLFIISSQPYAAAFAFVFLVIKALALIKRQ